MHKVVKYSLRVGACVVIYFLTMYFLIGVARYHALVMVIKSQLKIKSVCMGLILVWYSEMYCLLWIIDILSIINKDRIIVNVIKNIKIFNHEHLTLLMKKVLTKCWWRQLKTRKPSYEILVIMRLMIIPIIYHAVTSYSSGFLCFGAFLFHTQFINFEKFGKGKRQVKHKAIQYHNAQTSMELIVI